MRIEFKNIHIAFGRKTLVNDFSMQVNPGEKVVIRGASGSGKTTLLHLLTGFIRPDAGQVLIDGQPLTGMNISKVRAEIAYLPQQINFSDLSVKAFVMMPFRFSRNKGDAPEQAEIWQVFEKLALKPEILSMSMQDISGGEKQRVGLASCLLLKRKVMIFDEPTAALDKEVKKQVLDFIFSLKNLTMISSSHDDDWVARCNKTVEISKHHG